MKLFNLFLLAIIININFIFAQTFYGGSSGSFSGGYQVIGASSNPQFNNPNFLNSYDYTSPQVYWPKYGLEDCYDRQDFIMQIAPGGCSPAVVRSDLLEEQNVPVFCKVMGVQVNPLIDVSRIRSLHFTGNYPKGVSGISYFPARAAINSQTQLENSPLKDNLGYVVIVLSQVDKEQDMPESVEGNITAVLDYDSEKAFGIGNTNFYVNEMNDLDWPNNYKYYSFWNGKGYIRAESIDSNSVTLSLYRDVDTRLSTVTLKPGETSKDIYLSGFYCAAAMNINLESVDAPVDSALLQINDMQYWVAKGDRILDSKCTVVDLYSSGGGGRVRISCPVKNGNFELSLNPGKANFSYNGISREYAIGEKLDGTTNVFLAYVGQDYTGTQFVVLINDSTSYTINEFESKEVYPVIQNVVARNERLGIDEMQNQIKSAIKSQYSTKLRSFNQQYSENQISIEVIKINKNSALGYQLNDVSVPKNREWDLTKEDEKNAKEYYDSAIKYYRDTAELYPNEKLPSFDDDPYAVRALYAASQLAKRFRMNQDAQEFYNKIINNYPNSKIASKVINEKELMMKYDGTKSKALVYINNQQYFIDLLDFKRPSKSELSAVILINGKEEKIGMNEIKNLESYGSNGTLQLTAINDDYIELKYYGPRINVINSNRTNVSTYSETTTLTQRLTLRSPVMIGNTNVQLLNVYLKKQAKISINPKVFGTRTESNFSFKIGIEKRGIKLSTEQTLDLISNLNKAIKDWTNINDKLGKVVQTMKAACFATSAVLNVKTFLSGLSGESMARKEIMTGKNGWNEYCEKLISEGSSSPINGKAYSGSTVQKCLLDHNSQIENDVKIYGESIKSVNKQIEELQKQVGIEKTDILDMQGQVDSKKVEDLYKQKFSDYCKDKSGFVTLSDRDRTNVSVNTICSWDSMTHEQRRDIVTLLSVKDNSGASTVLKNMTNSKLADVVLSARNFNDNEGARKKAEEEANKYNLGIRTFSPAGDQISYGDIKRISQSDVAKENVYKNYKVGDSVIRVFIPKSRNFGASKPYEADPEVAGKEVIVQLKLDEFRKDYIVDNNGKAYNVDGSELSEKAKASVKDYMSQTGLNRFRQSDAKAYQNRMIETEKIKVEYFENAPYKGMPSLVPFDVDNGWYVKLEYILTGVGKPYDESGRAVNFYICNVGENGIIEFKKSGDDICRYYNGQVSQLEFPGMASSDSARLLSSAQQAITEAAKQYGKKRVVVNGRSFDSGIAFGSSEGRCTDFMSPMDCNIMFNVCDPVMCPSSRCDLGGKYRVDNVVQTGVLGSLLLCLPNYKEGIIAPICLSGVHAGIEGYISILNSTAQCLNESITTGKNIGICDEIKSIYVCEFFWKQATPLLNVIIPRMFDSLMSQGVRGGGEYLSVENSWNNLQSSINYFKNDYAVNSMIAFNKRSTDEIGGEVCKSFMSTNYPSSLDFFDRLIEPDSPVQYHAWFSEDQLTTATIPPTSQYKVYFHIYSGKDQGSYYVIYLKDLPQSNYIYTSQTVIVDRGYIAIGSQVDKAVDFSGPSGYKQVCISLNGQDYCGFGKVTSSYLLNSVSDQYASEQVKTGIKSQSECIAGTPSLYSMVQPNLQSGVENTINPQLYNQGIIRICASQNPGKRVLANGQYDTTNSTYDRYKEVGYCDDPTIKCWLDTQSVKDVIIDKGILNQTLDKVNLNMLGVEGYYDDSTSKAISSEGEKFVSSLVVNKGESKDLIENKIRDIVDKLVKLSNLAANNIYRARALYILGNLYSKIADSVYPEAKSSTGVSYSYNITPSTIVNTVSVINNTGLSDSDITIIKNFYREEDGRKYLKVYNPNNKNIEELEIQGINFQTAEVYIDDTTKNIVIERGYSPKLLLQDYTFTNNAVEWSDDMLKTDVLIKINHKGSIFRSDEVVAYKYSISRGWISDDNLFNNENLGYVSGIRYLVNNMKEKDSVMIENSVIERKTTDSDDSLSEQIFRLLKK